MGWTKGDCPREMFSPPTQREGLENKGDPPFLAVSPLQSSSGLPRLPVLALQKDRAEAVERNSC